MPCCPVAPVQVLDEAYIEFAGEESKLKWVQKHDNLVVLRTFSKSAGGSHVTLTAPGHSHVPVVISKRRGDEPCRHGNSSPAFSCIRLPNLPVSMVSVCNDADQNSWL